MTAWIVRHRRAVVAAWIGIFALLAPGAAKIERVLDVSMRIDGSESAAVNDLVRERFHSPFANYAVLVVTGLPSFVTDTGRRALEQIVGTVVRVPGVSGTLSAVDHPDSVFVPASGDGTFVLVGFVPGAVPADTMIARLRSVTERLTTELRPAYPRVTLRWSGELALNHDLRRVSAEDAQSAERRALPLTLALLGIAFGSVVAALLPLATALVAITVSLGIAAIIAAYWPLSILLENMVTMLGLGLGVDYALLMVSRFREELRIEPDADIAAERAARAAGHTIGLSAIAVLLGFVILLVIPLDDLRAVAAGGVLVVSTAALLAATLLPALLAMIGERIQAGRYQRSRCHPEGRRPTCHSEGGRPTCHPEGRRPTCHPEGRRPTCHPEGRRPEGSGPSAPESDPSHSLRMTNNWQRWAAFVSTHPVLVLTGAGVPLLILAWQTTRIVTSLPSSNWLPARMESARALHDLAGMGRAGVVQSLRIVIELPPGVSALEPRGWSAVVRLGEKLERDTRVDRVQSLPWYVSTQLGVTEADLSVIALLPAHVLETFVSRDQRTTLVEILPHSHADYPALTRLAREVREMDAAQLTGLPGARLHVGGMPAFNADYEDAISARFGAVVTLVIVGTFLALFIGFRSVLVPLKAIALNLLSVAASLGTVVLVFQEGWGAQLFGVKTALGGLFPALPALVFCLVFGLSMDYEVFLVARIAEARRRGHGDVDAIAEGLQRTGGVITSAAAIMIVVFAAFTLGGFLMIKILGFALATAVLIDATIVRLAIGPALLQLAGRWNWWPGERLSAGRAADTCDTGGGRGIFAHPTWQTPPQ